MALENSSLVVTINHYTPLPQMMLLILFFRRLVIFQWTEVPLMGRGHSCMIEADDTCRYRFKISAHNLPHSIDGI